MGPRASQRKPSWLCVGARVESKSCKICGRTFSRKYTQSIERFRKQQTCSTPCRHKNNVGRKFDVQDIAPDGGMTFQEIAKELGVSRGMAQKIYTEAVRKLRVYVPLLQ